DLPRPSQSQECALRPGRATAGRAVRLPGVHAVLTCLHPPPGQPKRASGPPTAQPPQHSVPSRRHTRGAFCGRKRNAGRLHSANAATTGGRGMSGEAIFILVLLVLFLIWLMIVRPQRRRQMYQESMIDHLRIGDEVLTAGGFFATVVRIDEDEVTVELSPGNEARLDKRAIAMVMPDEDETDTETEETDEAPVEADADAEAAESIPQGPR